MPDCTVFKATGVVGAEEVTGEVKSRLSKSRRTYNVNIHTIVIAPNIRMIKDDFEHLTNRIVALLNKVVTCVDCG